MGPGTLPELYLHNLETFRKPDVFRVKRQGVWRDVSALAVREEVAALSSGLAALGIEPGGRVALLSETRLEWALADLAIQTAGAVTVPIFPTLPASQVEFILRDARAAAAIVSTPEQVAKIASARPRCPDIRAVVAVEEPGPGGEAIPLHELRRRGRELARRDPELHGRRALCPRPEDLATILYTSGTTGAPKGVMLSHRNIVSNVQATLQVLPLGSQDTCLSFLPLSHILERMAGLYSMLACGATIAYAESLEAVADNFREVRPTIAFGVPRFYEKIRARILSAVDASPPWRRAAFRAALAAGRAAAGRGLRGEPLPSPIRGAHAIADRLVLRRAREALGGRLRFLVSGGAPLPREVGEFFFALGIPLLEGYGLTESSPVLAVNTLESPRLGTVGRPIPGVEIAIAPDGEILARGPNIMIGYVGREDLTRETLAGGWFHTGDIGHIDPDGYLVITDRKKDILVTSGGKNIAPQPLEARLRMSPLISEACVLGDGRPFICALIVPAFEQLAAALRQRGVPCTSRAEMAAHPEAYRLVAESLEPLLEGLAPHERIRRFLVLAQEPTIESGELTPTLKVRRALLAERYRREIEEIYKE